MSVRHQRYRDPKTGAVGKHWIVDIKFQHPDGRTQRVRKVSPIQTRRGAEQYERSLRQCLLSGTYGKEQNKEPVPTLEAFHHEFLTSYAVNNNKPSEISAKEGHFRVHLIPFFGRKKLDAIGARDIEKYKGTKLAAGYNKKTINNQLSTLRKLLNVALEWELIEKVPKVKPFKPEPTDYDFLDFDESERLINAAESGWTKAMVITALNTGLRLGELMALRWEDVDLVAGRLRVRQSAWKGQMVTPKSGRPRELPLNSRVLAALKAHRHLRGEYVFCQDDGAPLTQQIARKALMRACKFAGLRHVQWHSLRHTFASQLVMRRVPMKAVQELLGHATMSMTMRYSHLSPDVRKDAVEVLVTDPSEAELGQNRGKTSTRPKVVK
jgi:integrase